MKAEHRKELQTNLLADRMGRLIQNVKTRPSRRALLYVILGLAVLAAGVIIWVIRSNTERTARDLWMNVEEATDEQKLDSVAKDAPKSSHQGKTARMMLTWISLWERGVKNALRDPGTAVKVLRECRAEYVELAEECKEDHILGSEALYGIAVCEESLACFAKPDELKGQLTTAREKFKEVFEKFPKTGFGELADKRYNELDPDKEPYLRIERFYQSVQLDLLINRQRQFDIPFHKQK